MAFRMSSKSATRRRIDHDAGLRGLFPRLADVHVLSSKVPPIIRMMSRTLARISESIMWPLKRRFLEGMWLMAGLILSFPDDEPFL